MESPVKNKTTSLMHRVHGNNDSSDLCLETSSVETAYGKPCSKRYLSVNDYLSITTLLAAASRNTLEALDGAAFSARLTRKVRVQIRVDEKNARMEPDVQSLRYIFGSNESNSRLRKCEATRQRRVLLASSADVCKEQYRCFGRHSRKANIVQGVLTHRDDE